VTERKRILIVIGDGPARDRLRGGLEGEYELRSAEGIGEAIDAVRSFRPHLMTLDGSLGDGPDEAPDALSLLGLARRARLRLKIIVVTSSRDRELAVRAIELGACDCCAMPLDHDEFAVLVRRALHVQELETLADSLPDRLSGDDHFENLVGRSESMKEVFATIRKVAAADVGVLLIGERGTGKEMVARGIHRLSSRSAAPFVVIDPRATPSEFLEVEIFGNGNGPFADAEKVPGKLEQTDGGTLFIPGVEAIPLQVQARLSSFLSSREIGRSGGAGPIRIDGRVIAATEKDLEDESASGGFLEDLYYRLGVVAIPLPPLRQRGEDIALLAEGLLCRYAEDHGRSIAGFTRGAACAMMAHAWLGNIPELESRVRRAVIMASGRRITAHDLGLNGEPAPAVRTLGEARDELERGIVVDALRRSVGNVSRAARSIGVSRSTVYDLIRKYDLDIADFKVLAGTENGRGRSGGGAAARSGGAGRRGSGRRP
jgi:two-component system NtrC family response regulator